MKKPRISLGTNDLRILKEVYNIDLAEPGSLERFQATALETLQRLHKTEREIYYGMYPHRRKRIPNGLKCSFCLKADNEVHAMAKHESGFNLCNKCIKNLQSAEEE